MKNNKKSNNICKNIRKDINNEIKEFGACVDKYTSIEYYYRKNEWEIYHLC